ncbi:hypothetical protein FHT01_002353 [Sphingomonas japonica]|uniref:Uncharacterized protein n=1 Tax=Sphingomonas japonica TaxID=511662 RepID=A0ABX0U2K7_9SPHN|nr:hypothetical protein [Sphingomonas japonica]
MISHPAHTATPVRANSGGVVTPDAALLSDLARVKALFQLRAVVAVMGVSPDSIDHDRTPA